MVLVPRTTRQASNAERKDPAIDPPSATVVIAYVPCISALLVPESVPAAIPTPSVYPVQLSVTLMVKVLGPASFNPVVYCIVDNDEFMSAAEPVSVTAEEALLAMEADPPVNSIEPAEFPNAPIKAVDTVTCNISSSASETLKTAPVLKVLLSKPVKEDCKTVTTGLTLTSKAPSV